MHIFRRENVDYFVHYVFQEFHGFLVAYAQHIVEDSPGRTYFVRTSCTAKFRISSQCGQHVSGQVYFGNYGDVALLCVFHNFACLLLRIETAVRRIVILARVVADDRTLALRTYFGQFRVFLDFNAPSLVIGQMPVEGVHVVQGQQINVFFDELNGEEVAAYVEVHTTVSEARFILNLYGW